MSRRFSNDPINLIDRIPSRAQLSAAKPPQRAWGRVVLESGAACARGLANATAQLRKLCQMVRSTAGHARASGRTLITNLQTGWIRAAELTMQMKERAKAGAQAARLWYMRSCERLAEWIANLDASVTPSSQANTPPASEPVAVALPAQPATSPHHQFQEFADLKASFMNQQQELAHVSAQLQELKALVVSQQQVLMFLGKELETGRVPSATAVASSSPKQARVVRAKPGSKEKKPPQKGASKPSLNF